jgi:uncharacterized protein YkwD
MGSRQVFAFIGAVILAGIVVLSCAAVQPEEAVASTATRTCGGGSISLDFKEKRILALHNEARARHGLRPLCVDSKLTGAAGAHSREMIKKDYFSHSSYNGDSMEARLGHFGYRCGICAENIAGGGGKYAKPATTFRRWMNSPGHRSNILKGKLRRVGLGVFTGSYKGYQGYAMYTIDFGAGT